MKEDKLTQAKKESSALIQMYMSGFQDGFNDNHKKKLDFSKLRERAFINFKNRYNTGAKNG